MSIFEQDALTLLRVMQEHAIIAGNAKKASEVMSLAHLKQEDFDRADTFLLTSGYVKGTMGGMKGSRWLTPLGVGYVKDAMADRLRLGHDAECVLRHVVQFAHHGDFCTRADCMSALGLDSEKYGAACQMLADFNLITDESATGDEPFDYIMPTQEGRQTVHMNFARPLAPSTHIQAGAIFQASVTGSNIQAIASAFNSQIKQVVTQSDPAALRQEIARLLEDLTNSVMAGLTLEQKQVYSKVALDFKTEVERPQPDAPALHRLLALLGFAGDLDGTIEPGIKSLELSVAAAPYVLTLGQAVLQLLNSPRQ